MSDSTHVRFVFNTAIKACANSGDYAQAEAYFEELISRGIQPNSKGMGKMMEAAGKAGQLDEAERWFNRKKETFGYVSDEDSVVSINQMIDAAAKVGNLGIAE